MKYSFAIQTKNGFEFDPSTGKINTIDIRDITHALSNLCRYAGHCKKFYSVAEHSVLTYKIAKKLWPDDLKTQWAALLHDATEAYVGDVPTPLKVLLPRFNTIEDELQSEIARVFGIKWTDEITQKVKQVDLQALATEAKILFKDISHWQTTQGIDTHPELLSPGFPKQPNDAKEYFTRVFNKLKKELELK